MAGLVLLLMSRAARAEDAPSPPRLEPTEFVNATAPTTESASEQAPQSSGWDLVAFSSDGSRLALVGPASDELGGYDVWLWNVESGKVTTRGRVLDKVEVVSFSPDGTVLAVGPSGPAAGVKLLNTQTGQIDRTLPGPVTRVTCIGWSSDGKRLALGSTLDKSVRVWNLEHSQFERAWEVDLSNVLAVGFTRQGKLLAVGSPARERVVLKVVDVETGVAIQTWTGHKEMIEAAVFYQGTERIVSAGWDASVRVWDVARPEPLGELSGHKKGVSSLAISADGKRIASASAREFKLWDGEKREWLADLGVENEGARSVALSPDGAWLVSIHRDRTAHLWDVDKKSERMVLNREAGEVASTQSVPGADPGTASPPPSDAPEPEAIQALAYSQDGQWLAIAREDGRVSLRTARDGKVHRELEAFTDVAASVAFSPDSQLVASASFDKSIKVWKVESGDLVTELAGHTNWIFGVAFSPDGQTLASASYDKTVRVWDLSSGTEVARLTGHTAGVRAVAFTRDGKRLISGGSDRTAIVWNLQTQQAEATLKGHSQAIRDIACSPNGERVATASEDGTIRLWKSADWTEAATARGMEGVMFWCLAYSPQGRTLAAGAFDGTVKLFDPDDGKERATLTGPTDAVTGVAFAPDAHELVVGSIDKSFRRYPARQPAVTPGAAPQPVTLKTGEAVTALNAVTLAVEAPVLALAFDPRGSVVYVGTGGYRSAGALQAWNLSGHSQLWTTEPFRFGVPGLAASSTGNQIAIGNFADNFVRLYDAQGDKLKELRGHRSKVHGIAWSADGKFFATASLDREIKLWDARTNRELRTLLGHKDYVLSIQFSPDSNRLLSGSADQTARIWNVESGQEIRSLTGHDGMVQSVCFSRDGKRIATASADGTCRIYDAVTGNYLLTLRGHRNKVESVAFSPEGSLLATGSSDRTLRLWDASSGAERLKLTQDATVRAVLFAPDGRTLASGGDDKTLRLWDVAGFRSPEPTQR